MILLPTDTNINRTYPKARFLANLDIPNHLKNVLNKSIESFCWKNCISPTSCNLASGEKVKEIQLFEIELREDVNLGDLLVLFDRKISFFFVFLIKFQGKYKLFINYKEKDASNRNEFKVIRSYQTQWMNYEQLTLQIDGLNMDSVYEGFVRQVGGDLIKDAEGENKEKDFSEIVEQEIKIKKLNQQIEVLKKALKNEKQPNRQLEKYNQLKNLEIELNKLKKEGKENV